MTLRKMLIGTGTGSQCCLGRPAVRFVLYDMNIIITNQRCKHYEILRERFNMEIDFRNTYERVLF